MITWLHVCVFMGVNVYVQGVEPLWQGEVRTNREELIQSVRWQNGLTHPTPHRNQCVIFLLCVLCWLELASFKFPILEILSPVQTTFCELSRQFMTISLATPETNT